MDLGFYSTQLQYDRKPIENGDSISSKRLTNMTHRLNKNQRDQSVWFK